MPNSTSDKAIESDVKGPPHRTTAGAESFAVLRQDVLELSADDRLRLIVQLWKSLPVEHRSALLTLQMEDAAPADDVRDELASIAPARRRAATLVEQLFDPQHTSDLYSAPRRFDLATIFVVTAAYSVLLGGLTAMGWPPSVKVFISLLAAVIAVTQAMFQTVANPRGVSVVTGSAFCTLFIWVAYALGAYRYLHVSLPAATVFLGVIGGSLAGYLVGTCVGGVFLVADVLRGKFERRNANDGDEPDSTVASESAEESAQ